MSDAERAYEFLQECADPKLNKDGLREYFMNLIGRADVGKVVEEIHCDEYFCPNCGAENNCDEYVVTDRYCPVCGQKLIGQKNHEGQVSFFDFMEEYV